MAVAIGVLVLDTRFPRIAGDIGNADSFPFPVLFETLKGIGPQQAVRDAPDRADLVDTLAVAADRLVRRGAGAIAPTRGFLVLLQRELAARCSVPVATSGLLQVPVVERLLPAGKRVGIITAEARSLTQAHLDAAGIATDTPIVGMPEGGSFAHTFLDNNAAFDRRAVQAEVVAAGRQLLALHPNTASIVLECANLPPYSLQLHDELGLPVYDMRNFLSWVHAGLEPDRPIGGIS